MDITSSNEHKPKIGIIGGGIAGSTIALKLSRLGLAVELFEAGPSLVNGPPMCHLHAGGNLYREIDDQQCLTLLRQSIDSIKLYGQAIDFRPTVIAIPKRDGASIDDLLPRLNLLRSSYQNLVDECQSNAVLGPVEDYYRLVDEAEAKALACLEAKAEPESLEDWLIPAVKELDFSKIHFPLLAVQEFGWSLFRLAANAKLALDACPQVVLRTSTKVLGVEALEKGWRLSYRSGEADAPLAQVEVDYLVNACGYRSGELDDNIGLQTRRLVEFKAAYISRWRQAQTPWPELIFYGQRGTPHGMAQLTPYPDGYFQIHGMTKDITLFEQGLVASSNTSAQPQLPAALKQKLDANRWPVDVAAQRSQKAIDFIAYFLPNFTRAEMAGPPLFGAQQIPGDDPELRASDVSFNRPNYARCEIVKASSAIDAADEIAKALGLQVQGDEPSVEEGVGLEEVAVDALALQLAQQRGYPRALAKRNKASL